MTSLNVNVRNTALPQLSWRQIIFISFPRKVSEYEDQTTKPP